MALSDLLSEPASEISIALKPRLACAMMKVVSADSFRCTETLESELWSLLPTCLL